MDYGYQNNPHGYAAPQLQPPPQLQSHQPPQPQPQPQPQPPQPAGGYPYSSYYSTANPNPYPYQVARHEDPSQSIVFTDGVGVQAADPYAVETGFEGQGVPYGYQSYQHAAPYPYTRTIAAASSDQIKRKFMVHSNMLDLESKKQKVIEGGAAADAVRICTVCNVVCNSDKVFASHLAGEKHLLKALGRNSQTNVSNVLAHLKKNSHAKIPNPKALKKPSIGVRAAPKIMQTFVCEVCQIDCNCIEAFNSHKMGRKHKAKLLLLQQSIAPKPPVSTVKAIPEATDMESGKKSSSAKEGLQVKKEKVLQGGAHESAIMECILCDVICNSKSVYDSHVTGKKHLSMVNKQAVQV